MDSIPSRGKTDQPSESLIDAKLDDEQRFKKNQRSEEARMKRRIKRRNHQIASRENFKVLKQDLHDSGLSSSDIKLKLQELRRERKSGTCKPTQQTLLESPTTVNRKSDSPETDDNKPASNREHDLVALAKGLAL
jgi:hypothetical protein